jgi:hypothetical protein
VAEHIEAMLPRSVLLTALSKFYLNLTKFSQGILFANAQLYFENNYSCMFNC